MLKLAKNRTWLFYKYLISYLLIFLIPFLMISIVFYQMSVNSIQDEIEQSNMAKLQQVRDIADARMQELQGIAHRISMDHRLTPYMFTEPYNSKQAIRELTTYQVNSSVVDSLFLYYYGQDNIYSSRGMNTLDVYTDVYRIAPSEVEQLTHEMETIDKPTVRALDLETGNDQIIAYMYPVTSNSLTPYGTIAFFVKDHIFTNMIHHALGPFEGNIYIFNSEQEQIASYTNGDSLAVVQADQLSQLSQGVTSKQFNGQDYSLVSATSDDSNWTYVTAMPTEQFYAKMDAMRTTIITIVAIIAIIGICSTIYMAFKQYKPIHVLNQSIKAMHGRYFPKQHKDEIASIQESFQIMHQDSEQLQKKMKVHEPYLRDQIVLKLINGDITALKEQAVLLEDLQMSLQGSHKFIFVVSIRNHHDRLVEKERILGALQEVQFKEGTGYGVELIHDQAVAVFVDMCADEEHPDVLRKKMMTDVMSQITALTDMNLMVGVGGIYEQIARMNSSLIEAKASIEYALIHNHSGKAVYFEQITSQSSSAVWFQSHQQVKLHQSLKQGDQAVAKEAVKHLLTELKEKDITVYMLKSMCFDLVNTILKSTADAGIQYDRTKVKMLVEFKSLDELEKAIEVFITDICFEVKRTKQHQQNEIREHILHYLHQEYTSHSMSLEQIAEGFQLSSSYVSRLIKEQTGYTFTQYIWKLRMEECKRQLRDTSMPIKEIVQQIGYFDVANFTRKFRKEEGITPGQYRKNVMMKESAIGE